MFPASEKHWRETSKQRFNKTSYCFLSSLGLAPNSFRTQSSECQARSLSCALAACAGTLPRPTFRCSFLKSGPLNVLIGRRRMFKSPDSKSCAALTTGAAMVVMAGGGTGWERGGEAEKLRGVDSFFQGGYQDSTKGSPSQVLVASLNTRPSLGFATLLKADQLLLAPRLTPDHPSQPLLRLHGFDSACQPSSTFMSTLMSTLVSTRCFLRLPSLTSCRPPGRVVN